jgi:DNA-binding NarL/FixJ family response regulator
LAAADRITQFSELRWRIMQMAADGLSNPEIAYLTGRSRRVICWHLDATYRRLNLRNRVQLATWMAEKG